MYYKRKEKCQYLNKEKYFRQDTKGRTEDFAFNKEEARKWGKEHRDSIEKELTPVQKEALSRLHQPDESHGNTYDINTVLKETGGDVDNLPREDSTGNPDEKLLERIRSYNEDIDRISNVLTHPVSKLTSRLFVYKQMPVEELGYATETFWDTQGNFNIELGTKLIEDLFQFGLRSDFASVTAAYDHITEQPDQLVRLRLELPIGTHIIPVGDGNSDTIYLPKNHGFMIDDMSIEVVGNKDILVINAKYLEGNEKGQITDYIHSMQNSENRLWNDYLGFPQDKQIFDFRLSDTFASGMLSYAHQAIQQTILNENAGLNVNKEFLVNVTNYMIQGRGKVVFTDRLLGYLPELLEGEAASEENIKEVNNYFGMTNLNSRFIGLNGITSDAIHKDYDSLKDAFIHELTHMEDRRLGRFVYQEDIDFSSKSDRENGFFHEIYEDESPNLIEPFFDNSEINAAEYLAEVHSFMYSTQVYKGENIGDPDIRNKTLSEIVHLRVPETVAWIKEHLYKKRQF